MTTDTIHSITYFSFKEYCLPYAVINGIVYCEYTHVVTLLCCVVMLTNFCNVLLIPFPLVINVMNKEMLLAHVTHVCM